MSSDCSRLRSAGSLVPKRGLASKVLHPDATLTKNNCIRQKKRTMGITVNDGTHGRIDGLV